ncbi:hypothetical protein [Aquipseudomonas alcaligenes]|uniref:hypothetical protein n=1 Tax=Aquipseudomonas alcaligenes TaxID=43263 RepID=UPI00165927A1|nr:hypothetical protein [Pseudomonas alcaligenes]
MKAIESLKLYCLLWVSTFLVRRASKKNSRIQQLLKEKPFVFQVCTSDGAAAYLELRGARLKMHLGQHPLPDFSQRWRRAKDAVSVMLNRDETELLRALEDGRCELQGSFLIGMWLNEVLKLARSF